MGDGKREFYLKAEERNVVQVLKNCRKIVHEKIDTGNGSTTFFLVSERGIK
jgi:hypothetical protein